MENEILEILKQIQKDNQSFKADIKQIQKDTQDFRNEVTAKLDEHTQILRTLEHSAEVNKAEHDRMANDVTHIKGDVIGLRKDLANVEIITSSNWNELARLKAVK